MIPSLARISPLYRYYTSAAKTALQPNLFRKATAPLQLSSRKFSIDKRSVSHFFSKTHTAILIFAALFAIGALNASSRNTKPEAIDFKKFYAEERASLSLNEIHTILNRGKKIAAGTDMLHTLSEGGSAIFPHCSILNCGDQVAAVVDASLKACVKTGKNQILLIGVLHGQLSDDLLKARRQEKPGEVINHPCRGIFGPELLGNELLKKEFSLDNFIFLLEHAAIQKGIQVPRVIARYPYGIQGEPATVTGIDALQQLAKTSIIVATSDLFHYGTAYYYKSPENKKIPISREGYDFAYKTIEENMRILSSGNLLAYAQYCDDTNSDSRNVGQILRFLLGPMTPHIRNLKLVDVSPFFDKPEPNWVATSLVELIPEKVFSNNSKI